jgi:hypothetical protein
MPYPPFGNLYYLHNQRVLLFPLLCGWGNIFLSIFSANLSFQKFVPITFVLFQEVYM